MVPLVIAVVAPIVTAAVGKALAAGDEEEARRLRQQAVDQYGPEMEQEIDSWIAEQLGPSRMEGVEPDAASVAAQKEALGAFLDTARQGGLNLADRAALREIEQGEAQRERGEREAILGGMRRRGGAGSGYELAAQLQSQQSGADRMAGRDLGVAAQAQQRALDAWGRTAGLGGQIRGQGFEEQSQKARAADAIALWNAAARQQLPQQKFAARMNVRGQRSNALLGQSQAAGQQAAGTQQMLTGIGQGAGYTAGAYAQQQGNRDAIRDELALEQLRRKPLEPYT